MSRSRLTRRAVLSWGLGGVGALAVAGLPGTFAAAAAAVTLWQLDPDWGTPRTSPSGKVRTRCRGAACHSAAPHRFFLTEADARAGRLHPGCLAEPVAVTVTLSLGDLAPYYRARLGGVDARCPDLPADLLAALTSFTPGPAIAAAAPTTTTAASPTTAGPTTDVPGPTTTAPSSRTAETAPPDAAVDGLRRHAASPGAGELAFSGGDAATTAAAALAAMALGAVALGAASVRSERDDPPRS